ncbi:MAG: hypothetical protein KJZ74_08885 [Gemmatimonadales bacterium]|nr:hypothetical protein [Gemmatimonadota bacterium]MCL4214016.1 hypothetical protein [Gemmatimonadales bacterium]
MRRSALLTLLVLLLPACAAEERVPEAAVDRSCFGGRVLSFRDLVAEVVIPAGETCDAGTFQVVFTRGADTLATLTETRVGTVGFIGTADVNGDGRGEFFVSTRSIDADARGALFAYTEGATEIGRLQIAPLDSAQLEGYAGQDRFGFGGADQLVRAFPRASGDTAWFGYAHGTKAWNSIQRPAWVR